MTRWSRPVPARSLPTHAKKLQEVSRRSIASSTGWSCRPGRRVWTPNGNPGGWSSASLKAKYPRRSWCRAEVAFQILALTQRRTTLKEKSARVIRMYPAVDEAPSSGEEGYAFRSSRPLHHPGCSTSRTTLSRAGPSRRSCAGWTVPEGPLPEDAQEREDGPPRAGGRRGPGGGVPGSRSAGTAPYVKELRPARPPAHPAAQDAPGSSRRSGSSSTTSRPSTSQGRYEDIQRSASWPPGR